MIDAETQAQIEEFLQELGVLMDDGNTTDFSDLYAKYPKVRVGLRRAMLVVQKRRATSSSSFSSSS